MDANAQRTHSVCASQSPQWNFGPWSTRRHSIWACGASFFIVLIGVLMTASESDAANYRTQNFLVEAPTPQLAKSVGDAAERYRDDLATYWTGSKLQPWPAPCPVRVVAGPNLAAQGVTTYNPAPVRDFQMEVIGTPERILDSVLPHEVTHTVLATFFGRPLPRWADEGICTTVEHVSERTKHEAKLREFLSSRRGIAMNRLFLLTEYPADVLPMYAQGYSVCQFLIAQQGPKTFIEFLQDYMQRPSWTANVQKHYGYDSLAELQEYWLSWVEAGSGPVAQFVKADTRAAAAPDAAVASLDTSTRNASSRSPRRSAPATALAATSRPPRGHAADRNRNLVAANDRGRVSESDSGSGWYHRRAEGLDSPQTEIEMLPPGDRVAVATVDNSAVAPEQGRSSTPTWAPPSVLASGRYSAATPQAETSGSIPSNPAVLDSRVIDRAPTRSIWR